MHAVLNTFVIFLHFIFDLDVSSCIEARAKILYSLLHLHLKKMFCLLNLYDIEVLLIRDLRQVI
jgi:hypothetical protein